MALPKSWTKEEKKEWRLAHKDLLKSYYKKFHERQEKKREKKYPGKQKELWEKHYAANTEKVKARAKKYNTENVKKHSEATKKWRRKNPEMTKAAKHRRRVSEASGGILSPATVKAVYEDNIKRFGTLTCYLCLKPIAIKEDHLEHKTPVSRGGTNEYTNLGISCCKCNSQKGRKTLEEFLSWLG
jgi:5-methylcytosine-specific restriction endonuclease McrA